MFFMLKKRELVTSADCIFEDLKVSLSPELEKRKSLIKVCCCFFNWDCSESLNAPDTSLLCQEFQSINLNDIS